MHYVSLPQAFPLPQRAALAPLNCAPPTCRSPPPLSPPKPRLRACDWSSDHGLLLGTWASELLLVPSPNVGGEPRVIASGHAQAASCTRSADLGSRPISADL